MVSTAQINGNVSITNCNVTDIQGGFFYECEESDSESECEHDVSGITQTRMQGDEIATGFVLNMTQVQRTFQNS